MFRRKKLAAGVPTIDLAGRVCGTRQAGAAASATKPISLKVLPTHPPLRKSRMGWKRAAVLIGVHVVFVIHIVQWYISGMRSGEPKTISPIEPSESMAAIELGEVNAGLVFFIAAILATFIFGRFFCGWGCHVVALQDLCAWFMKKLGVHPKPFRTRLLILMPLLMGSYMFVWPTFKRELLKPAVTSVWGADTYEHLAPFIGEAVPRPIFEPEFVVEDFWATFAPWPIAIPFLLICGFATVYFLGAKGFCTYGCPYGGFFAPLDKFSPGKIVVNDNCEQCGHCTASCTSNVRVHEEVRDYGMVVDPGCMKCLDCVSVCPNNALSFGFAVPAAFKSPRTPQAKERRATHHVHYDLTTFEEVWVGLIFFVFTWYGFRGLLNSVPLLMSAGLGAIAAFTTWKLVRLTHTPNVRLGHLQLRIKGRFTRWGVAFVPVAVGLIALGVWGTVIRASREVGAYWDYQVRADNAFTPNYVPEPGEKAKALASIRNYTRGDSASAGGWGWSLKTHDVSRLSWLYAVAGDKDSCVKMQERVVELIRADVEKSSLKNVKAERQAMLAEAILRLADFYLFRGDAPKQVEAFLQEHAAPDEGSGLIHIRAAFNEFRSSSLASKAVLAEERIRKGVELNRRVSRSHAAALAQAAQVLSAIGRGPMIRSLFEDEIKHTKEPAEARLAFAHFLGATGAVESAKEQYRLAGAFLKWVPEAAAGEANLFLSQNRAADAIKVLEAALTRRPRATLLLSTYARALQAAGRSADAAKQLRRWCDVDPRDQTPWISLAELERSKSDAAALAVFLEGEKHRGDDPVMLVVVAQELLKAKRTIEAWERLKRAVDLPPRHPGIRAQAKELLLQAGMKAEAESL
jgi:polyferredoxin/tetratricopeptide (TPR) repeat protein